MWSISLRHRSTNQPSNNTSSCQHPDTHHFRRLLLQNSKTIEFDHKEQIIQPMLFRPTKQQRSFCSINKHTLFQTLTTLQLESSQILDEGAQHLANALKTNQVTPTLVYNARRHISLQTLTTLLLGGNHISAKGKQYIFETLEINKVRTMVSCNTHTLIISDTHSVLDLKLLLVRTQVINFGP